MQVRRTATAVRTQRTAKTQGADAVARQAGADAVRVQKLAKSNPVRAAQLYTRLVRENRHPQYQRFLAQWSAASLAKSLQGLPAPQATVALTAVARAMAVSDSAAASGLANALAAVFPSEDNIATRGAPPLPWKGALEAVIARGGSGVGLGVRLSAALLQAGKGAQAEKLAARTREVVAKVRSDFEKLDQKVGELHAEVASHLSLYGPVLSEEQRAAAVADFRRRNADTFRQWEAAGARLAVTLNGLGAAAGSRYLVGVEGNKLRSEAEKALTLLPSLTETRVGHQAVTQALAAAGQGRSSFLDGLSKIVATDGRESRFATTLSNALVGTLAAEAVRRAAQGRPMAPELLAGIKRHNGLFGVSRAQADALVDSGLAKLRKPLNPAQAEAVLKSVRQAAAGTRSAAAFRGLGFVLGLGALGLDAGSVRRQDALGKARTLALAAQVGVDGATLIAHAVGRVSTGLRTAFPLATLVVSGLGAADAFRQGNAAQGGARALTALGGALVAFSVATGGAGALLGAAVIGTGLAADWAIGWWQSRQRRESQREDAADFLEAAGLSSSVAESIARTGGAAGGLAILAKKVAPKLGLTPVQTLVELSKLDELEREALAKVGLRLAKGELTPADLERITELVREKID